MRVSELLEILQTFDIDSDVIIYDDSTDRIHEINCVDTVDSDSPDEEVAIFI